MEVQRHVSIAPVAVAHRALKDSVLMGHTIPEVIHQNMARMACKICLDL